MTPPSTLAPPLCWDHPLIPVTIGPVPAGALTLADLATEPVIGELVGQVVDRGGRAGDAAAAAVGHALSAVEAAVLAPAVWHGIGVAATADDLAVTLRDGRVASVHLRTPPATVTAPSIGATGATVAELLDGVHRAAWSAAPAGSRSTRYYLAERIQARCRALDRARPVAAPRRWIPELIVAAGLPVPRPERLLRIRLDGGADVEVPVPRNCCAGRRLPPADACPTCPLLPDDRIRVAFARSWLAGLPGPELAFLAGSDDPVRIPAGDGELPAATGCSPG